MRTVKDILKVVKTGLALYEAYCLIGGVASDKINRNWQEMLDKTKNEVSKLIFGEGYKRPIECEYKVEDV